MIPPSFFNANVALVCTEVWRAPGLEIRMDVKSDGSRELHDGDGEKLCLWIALSHRPPAEYVRVGAFLSGEEKGEIEWPT